MKTKLVKCSCGNEVNLYMNEESKEMQIVQEESHRMKFYSFFFNMDRIDLLCNDCNTVVLSEDELCEIFDELNC